MEMSIINTGESMGYPWHTPNVDNYTQQTLYYRIAVFWDLKRKIIGHTSNLSDEFVRYSDRIDCPYIITNWQSSREVIVRIFRGVASNTYSQVCDVFVSGAYAIIDDNLSCGAGGFKWIDIETTSGDSSGYVVDFISFINENVEVVTTNISIPTKGYWEKGDFIKVITPNQLGIRGFYCSTSGEPGTWITLT